MIKSWKRYFSTRHTCVWELLSHNGVAEDTGRVEYDTDRRGTTHSLNDRVTSQQNCINNTFWRSAYDRYTAELYRVNYSVVYSSLSNGIVCSLLIILLPRYNKTRHKYSQPMERFLAFVLAVQFCRLASTFRGNMLSPSSGLKELGAGTRWRFQPCTWRQYVLPKRVNPQHCTLKLTRLHS
jgi:hypothetical protein